MVVKNNNESTNTGITVHVKYNSISNIYINIGKDISDNYYEEISTIEKNAENEYYLVKWKIDSYNLQYSHNIVKDMIKNVDLVCDALYLNPFVNFKQWYTPYEKCKNNFQVE